MRKTLLFVALALGGASAASGQTLNHCGMRFEGRVSSVRVEKALYEKVGSEWVEGPRRLSDLTVYREDGLWSEQTVYDDAGNAASIYVRVCYENGRYAEIAHYDGARGLRTRQLFSPDGNVMQFFDAAGRPGGRMEFVRDAVSPIPGHRIYDGAGRLKREQVREREGQATVVKDLDGEGRLLAKTVSTGSVTNGEARAQHDLYVYGPHGAVGAAQTTDVSKGGRQPEQATTYVVGGRRKHETVRSEKDERGNVVKMTRYELNEATGEMEPRVVRYYEIIYF